MIDSNLLAFYIADATDGTKHHATFFQTRSDSEPEPAYSIKHPDPASPTSRNCYAAALFDPYAADILYGEVLINPKWTQPTLSQDEIRRNGGVPPPPEPIMPNEFTIQLYNPDQQINVTQRSGQLLGSTKWEFSMPQDTFRAPSSSMLDKSQNDPGAAVTTPRINFVWRKEGKFTKEMTCYVTGKSTDVQSKKKHKEADIAIASFKGLKEITIYEPNLYRVDMEDAKGLEVTILLSAAVIRDVFFGNVRQVFNVSGSGSGRKSSAEGSLATPQLNGAGAAANGLYVRPPSRSVSSGSQAPANTGISRANTNPQPPITDARTQWELDAETARLKAQVEAEERERKRQEDIRRREQERADAEETKRLKRLVEQEERERKAEQKRIDKETERLRKLHGPQAGPPQPSIAEQQQAAAISAAMAFSPGFTSGRPPPPPHSAPPVQQQPFAPPHHFNPPAAQSLYGMGPPPGSYVPMQSQQVPGAYQNPSSSLLPQNPSPRRRSFLNLRNFITGEDPNRLNTKRSSVW